jgi:hypothetical protein
MPSTPAGQRIYEAKRLSESTGGGGRSGCTVNRCVYNINIGGCGTLGRHFSRLGGTL